MQIQIYSKDMSLDPVDCLVYFSINLVIYSFDDLKVLKSVSPR